MNWAAAYRSPGNMGATLAVRVCSIPDLASSCLSSKERGKFWV